MATGKAVGLVALASRLLVLVTKQDDGTFYLTY